MTTQQILAIHPVPWRHVLHGNLIIILDAQNKQVELFTIVEFIQLVTVDLAQQQPQPQPTSAPL
jgi:hypothetical protein